MDNQDSSVYDNLVKKIVKAVPEIEEQCKWCKAPFSICCCTGANWENRDITLDDVLRFLNKPLSNERLYWYIVEDTGRIMRMWDYTTGDCEEVCLWSLGRSLEWHRDNAPETILSLNSII